MQHRGHQAFNHLCSKHSEQKLPTYISLPLKRHPVCLPLLVSLVLICEHKDLHASYKSKLSGPEDMAPQLKCLPYKQEDPHTHPTHITKQNLNSSGMYLESQLLGNQDRVIPRTQQASCVGKSVTSFNKHPCLKDKMEGG